MNAKKPYISQASYFLAPYDLHAITLVISLELGLAITGPQTIVIVLIILIVVVTIAEANKKR